MATIKEEVLSVKEELKEAKKQVKENSFAVELLREEKGRNQSLANAVKRIFVMWIITFVAFICLLAYTIWLLNDISVVETTEETYDVEQNSGDGGNNNFINGSNNEVTN